MPFDNQTRLLRDLTHQLFVDDLLEDIKRLGTNDGNAVDEKGRRGTHTQILGKLIVRPNFLLVAVALDALLEGLITFGFRYCQGWDTGRSNLIIQCRRRAILNMHYGRNQVSHHAHTPRQDPAGNKPGAHTHRVRKRPCDDQA
jgi:hypothetical protein